MNNMNQKPKSQKQLIHNTNWHILVLLDACRYDYFEKNIYDFVDDGELIKAKSEGSATCGWLVETWTDYYPDIIYISGNAFINSTNITICKYKGKSFNGNKHFGKVVDTWDYGFDKDTGRVDAEEINKDAYIYIKNDNKRYILHYQQPHAPYLFKGKNSTGGFQTNQYGLLRKIVSIFIPIKIQWKFICLSPFLKRTFVSKDRYIRMYKKYGKKKMKEAYERNLMSALVEVKKIVERYPDKNILITADHGERLGEDGQFGHGGMLDEFITTVPFYFIDRRKYEQK